MVHWHAGVATGTIHRMQCTFSIDQPGRLVLAGTNITLCCIDMVGSFFALSMDQASAAGVALTGARLTYPEQPPWGSGAASERPAVWTSQGTLCDAYTTLRTP